MVSEKINFLTQIFGIGEQNTDNASVLVKNELSEQFQQLLAQSLSAANKLDVAKKPESTDAGIVELLISPQNDAPEMHLEQVVNNKETSEEIIPVTENNEQNVETNLQTILSLQSDNSIVSVNLGNVTLLTTESENIVVTKTQTEVVLPTVQLPNVQKPQQDISISVAGVEVISKVNLTQEATVVTETKPTEVFSQQSIPVQTEKNIATEKFPLQKQSVQPQSEKSTIQQTPSAVPQKSTIAGKSGFEFVAPKESNAISSDNVAKNQDGKPQPVNIETDFNVKNNTVVIEQISVSQEKTAKNEQQQNPIIRTRVDSVLTAANESKPNISQRIVNTPTVVVTDAKRVVQDGGNAQILSELQTLERSKIKISSFEKGNIAPVIKEDVLTTEVSLKEVIQNIAEDVKTPKQLFRKDNVVTPQKDSAQVSQKENIPILPKQKVDIKTEQIVGMPVETKSDVVLENKNVEIKSSVQKAEKKQVVETLQQTVSEKPQQVKTDDSVTSKFFDTKQTSVSTTENTSHTIRQTETPLVRNEAPVRYSTALSEQWTKQTIDDIGRAASNVKLTEQSSEIRLKLHPEDLGEVTLTIKSENNKMNVTLRVNSSDVKDVLEKNLPMLQETLAQRGLDMRKIEVFNNNDANSQSRNRDEQHQHGQEKPKPQIFDEERAKQFERFFGYNTMEKTV